MLPNATRLAPVRSPSLAAHVNGTPHADADYPLSPAQSLLPARGMTLAQRESRGLFSSGRRALSSCADFVASPLLSAVTD